MARSPQVVNILAPRVKYEGELRLGHSKAGCPSCNQDVWVKDAQVRLLEDRGADVSLICRDCVVAH